MCIRDRDVNNSGTITTLDLVQLRRLILNMADTFANNHSWRFVEANYQFASNQPEQETFPEAIFIPEMEEQPLQLDFIGIKIGDVNGSAQTTSLNSNQSRNAQTNFEIELENKKIEEGDVFNIPLIIEGLGNLQGIQMTLALNDFLVLGLEEGAANLANINEDYLRKGILTLSWHKTANSIATPSLLSLRVQALKSGFLKDLLKIDQSKMAAEAYTKDDQIQPIKLRFTEPNFPNQFELFQNKPNPFDGRSTIGFYLPTSENVHFQIMDLQGRILKTMRTEFDKGYNEIIVNQADLGQTGIMYYQMTIKDKILTKKMIVLGR